MKVEFTGTIRLYMWIHKDVSESKINCEEISLIASDILLFLATLFIWSDNWSFDIYNIDLLIYKSTTDFFIYNIDLQIHRSVADLCYIIDLLIHKSTTDLCYI